MEDVVDSLQHVSYQFLLVLHLHGGVWLQQRVVARDCHLDLLNSGRHCHVEAGFLVRGHEVLVRFNCLLGEGDVLLLDYPTWQVAVELAHVELRFEW